VEESKCKIERPWIAVFPDRSEGPVLQQNGPEKWMEAGVSGASEGTAAVGCLRRVTALSGQTERPRCLHFAGGGPEETLAGLRNSTTAKTDLS
jgi:hypothetical protein